MLYSPFSLHFIYTDIYAEKCALQYYAYFYILSSSFGHYCVLVTYTLQVGFNLKDITNTLDSDLHKICYFINNITRKRLKIKIGWEKLDNWYFNVCISLLKKFPLLQWYNRKLLFPLSNLQALIFCSTHIAHHTTAMKYVHNWCNKLLKKIWFAC